MFNILYMLLLDPNLQNRTRLLDGLEESGRRDDPILWRRLDLDRKVNFFFLFLRAKIFELNLNFVKNCQENETKRNTF